jgi:multiple sugar transport system permease protein
MSNRSTRRTWRGFLGRALAVGVGLAMLLPLYLVFVFATHTDAEIMSAPAPIWFGSAFRANLAELLERLPHYWQNLGMSLRVAGAVALLQVVLCSVAGYAFAMLEFKGKDVLFALLLSTLLVPGFLGMIPHRMMIGWLEWNDRAHGLVVPAASSALGIFLMRQYVGKAISRELVEAARLDGCGTTGVFFRIVLPVVSPALAALALIGFLGAWNDLYRQMMTLHDMKAYTAPLALRSLLGTGHPPLGPMFAGAAVTMLPVIAVFALCARRLFRTLAVDSSAGE